MQAQEKIRQILTITNKSERRKAVFDLRNEDIYPIIKKGNRLSAHFMLGTLTFQDGTEIEWWVPASEYYELCRAERWRMYTSEPITYKNKRKGRKK